MEKTMQEMMNEMKEKSGSEFDEAFIETMIIHHKQAVEMTNDALEKAEDEELREMAKEMNMKQQEEIDKMENMRQKI